MFDIFFFVHFHFSYCICLDLTYFHLFSCNSGLIFVLHFPSWTFVLASVAWSVKLDRGWSSTGKSVVMNMVSSLIQQRGNLWAQGGLSWENMPICKIKEFEWSVSWAFLTCFLLLKLTDRRKLHQGFSNTTLQAEPYNSSSRINVGSICLDFLKWFQLCL